MYNELYEIWRREVENDELGRLPSDFYSRTADYLRHLKGETRMLDRKTAKAHLIVNEARNARRILIEIARFRSDKLIRKATSGEKPPNDSLTVEEERLFDDVCALGENYQVFIRGIIEGRPSQATPEIEHKFLAVRFLQDLPAIVGTDMKTYGPFKAEDVATLPLENAKLLTQRDLAGEIGVK